VARRRGGMTYRLARLAGPRERVVEQDPRAPRDPLPERPGRRPADAAPEAVAGHEAIPRLPRTASPQQVPGGFEHADGHVQREADAAQPDLPATARVVGAEQVGQRAGVPLVEIEPRCSEPLEARGQLARGALLVLRACRVRQIHKGPAGLHEPEPQLRVFEQPHVGREPADGPQALRPHREVAAVAVVPARRGAGSEARVVLVPPVAIPLHERAFTLADAQRDVPEPHGMRMPLVQGGMCREQPRPRDDVVVQEDADVAGGGLETRVARRRRSAVLALEHAQRERHVQSADGLARVVGAPVEHHEHLERRREPLLPRERRQARQHGVAAVVGGDDDRERHDGSAAGGSASARGVWRASDSLAPVRGGDRSTRSSGHELSRRQVSRGCSLLRRGPGLPSLSPARPACATGSSQPAGTARLPRTTTVSRTDGARKAKSTQASAQFANTSASDRSASSGPR
jgi:hypothetical protein